MALFRPLKLETAFFEPQALGIALYIRDRLGLDPGLGGSPGCRIAPAIAPEEQLVTADRDEVSAQWSSWWTTIFGAAVLRGVPGPIDYYGPLVHEPELGRVAETLLRDAIGWVAAQADGNRGEWGGLNSPTFRPWVVQELVQEARPRLRGAHSIVFLVLPVECKTGWRIGASFFGITKPLLHDLTAFRKWFAQQIPEGL
jgi:hypothetical protein